MGSRELAEWEIFYNLEPFGPKVNDINFGRLLHLLYSVNRSKDMEKMELDDWLLGEVEGKKPQSIEDMERTLKLFIKSDKKEK